MKRFFLIALTALLGTGISYSQLLDEQNVTIVMDLQPVLQLHMTTPDYIEFTFDDIKDYMAGITKYGATILKVSSSVNWDLYAVGTSTSAPYWDQQIVYSTGGGGNAVDNLPLSCLELHQYPANSYDGSAALISDYSGSFQLVNTAPGVLGRNTIFVSTTPYTPPTQDDKYIQGHAGAAPNDGAPAGSYLTVGGSEPSDFYFVIDYRIVPGLPPVFPFAAIQVGGNYQSESLLPGEYARPGIYTMNVKYVLIEDQ